MLRMKRLHGESLVVSDQAGNSIVIRVDNSNDRSVRLSIGGSKELTVMRGEIATPRECASIDVELSSQHVQ